MENLVYNEKTGEFEIVSIKKQAQQYTTAPNIDRHRQIGLTREDCTNSNADIELKSFIQKLICYNGTMLGKSTVNDIRNLGFNCDHKLDYFSADKKCFMVYDTESNGIIDKFSYSYYFNKDAFQNAGLANSMCYSEWKCYFRSKGFVVNDILTIQKATTCNYVKGEFSATDKSLNIQISMSFWQQINSLQSIDSMDLFPEHLTVKLLDAGRPFTLHELNDDSKTFHGLSNGAKELVTLLKHPFGFKMYGMLSTSLQEERTLFSSYTNCHDLNSKCLSASKIKNTNLLLKRKHPIIYISYREDLMYPMFGYHFELRDVTEGEARELMSQMLIELQEIGFVMSTTYPNEKYSKILSFAELGSYKLRVELIKYYYYEICIDISLNKFLKSDILSSLYPDV